MFAAVADEAPPPPTGDEAQRRLGEIETEGAALASQISQLQARQVELAAETETLAGQIWGMSPRSWLAARWGLTPKEASRLAWLGQRLQRLPKLAEAFAEGRLSEGVVTSMTSAATPHNEDAVLAVSEVATGAQMQTLLRDLRRLRPRQTNDDESYHADYEDDTGMLRGRFRLSPEHGAVFEAAMRAAREVDAEHEPTPAAENERPRERPRTTQVDALMRLADSFLAGTVTAKGLLPDRFHTTIVINTEDPDAEPGAAATVRAYMRGVGGLDLGSISPLLCESTLSVLVKQHGKAVMATSPTRLATKEQLQALLERDRCCTFPDCGREFSLIAHHVIHHADGGDTHVHNLVLLCKYHHGVVHQRGWRLEVDDDAHTKRFYRPDGTQVLPAGQRPARGDPDLPPLPDPGPRHLGCGDRLTEFARDVIVHDWLTADVISDATANAN